jgi:hypothetical protein
MSHALYPPPRPQSIGEVLDSAFRIFRASLFGCLPYGALAVVAGQLANIYDLVTGRPLQRFGGGDPTWWVAYALGALLAMALWNATVLRQHTIATGRPTAAVAELREGLLRAPLLFVLGILALLLMAVCVLPALAIPAPYRIVGFIVFGVPALYVAIALSCSWTALLLARKGVLTSMTYSFRLVRGNWWRIVLVYSVGLTMLLVFYALVGVLAGALVPFVGPGDIAVITAVSAVVVVAFGSVGTPFYSAIALAIFGDLQVRKEGIDLERRIAGAVAD